MNIILDTHVFLWALSDPEKIPSEKRREIETRANSIFVSSISFAELMIKASIGKIKVDFDPIDAVELSGFEFLDFSAQDAMLLKDLPFHHRDPFDRMLIAQSIANNYRVMTLNEKFSRYECKLI